jgi:hypothetical protein
MASYTDAIPQFNPYIQQLPVELMMKVGMQKQAQYDQGVQKIQSYIDSVAGMDVYRPQDKEYLESKLNELGSKLKAVSAADFSDQQVINSVGGMAGQLIKDPNIQAAVYSTAQIKKQNNKISEAEKKGILAPENKHLYERGLNSYLKGKLGETYTGQYTPYTNVYNEIKEIAKSVGIDEKIIPELFETDKAGNPISEYDPITKQSTPKINKVMAERHLKGKTAEKLLEAFNTSLSPQAKQQLAITGMYTNRNMTPEELATNTGISYDKHISKLETQRERINLELSLMPPGNLNKEKENDLVKSKENVDDTIAKLRKQRDEATDLNYVSQNADSVRSSLYSNNWLIGMADQMKEVSDITNYKINPWFEVFQKEKDYQLEIKKENRARQEFYIRRKEHAKDKEDALSQWRYDYYGKYGEFPEEVGKKPKTNIIAPIDEKDYEGLRGQFEGGYQDEVNAQNGLARNLALQFLRARNPNLSDEQLMKKVEVWTGGDEKDKTAMLNRFAGKLITNYDENPRNIPSEFHGEIEKLKILNNSVVAKGDAIRTIDQQAREQAVKQGLDVVEYDEVLRSVKPMNIGLMDKGQLKNLTLSSEDIINIVKTRPWRANILGKLTVSEDQKVEAANSEARLVGKYGPDKYKQIMDVLFPKRATGGEGSPPPLQIAEAEAVIYNATYKKMAKIKGELYAKSDIIPRTLLEPVKMGSDNSEVVSGNINAVLSKYQTMPNLDPSFNYDNAIKVANGDKAKTLFEIKQVGNNLQYTMVTTSKEGVSRAIVEPSDYSRIQGKPSHDATELDPMFLKLNSTGTTAKSNNIPWFGGRSFPLLENSKYRGVTGNLVNDRSNPDMVWFKLKVPGVKGVITFPDPIDHPEGLSKRNPDGSLNTNLSIASTAITPAILESLIQKNNN